METHQFDGCTIIYLTREDWGAGPLKAGHVVPAEQFDGWVLHHSAYGNELKGDDLEVVRKAMRHLQSVRPDLGKEVPYSTVHFRCTDPRVSVVAEGRGKCVTGAHTAGLNSSRYAWCFMGNADQIDLSPGVLAGMQWIAGLWTPFASVPTIGHQQAPPYMVKGANLNATGCPGADGLRHLPELQPPFFDKPSPPVPPNRRLYDMKLITYDGGPQFVLMPDPTQSGKLSKRLVKDAAERQYLIDWGMVDGTVDVKSREAVDAIPGQ